MMDTGLDNTLNVDMDMDGQNDHGAIETHTKIATFEEFNLKPELLNAVSGFLKHPTEVQCGCLPKAIQGEDILCQAKAGSGKATLSALALLHQLNYTKPGIYAVVICPTRHLVTKMIESYKVIAKHLPLIKIDTFGHKSGNLTMATGIHIGLGTPGRILRAIRSKKVDFSDIKHLVLYEADKMLSTIDMRIDIQDIYRHIPANTQTLIFSEKFSKEVRPICKQFLHESFNLFIDDNAKYISLNLDQFYISINEARKLHQLLKILKLLQFSLIIVYVKTPILCDTIIKLLKREKLSAAGYHLGMKPATRKQSILNFKKLRKQILVVSKLLEPEVDISTANVVIMYDTPTDADLFLKYAVPASNIPDTKGLTITFLPEDDDMTIIQELEEWYGATFTKLPNKIQLEVTSYSNIE